MNKSIVKELTDWHNLLQGGAGSFVGVIGAYAAALHAVRRQRIADRRLAEEQDAKAAAASVQTSIREVESALLGLVLADLTRSDVQSQWERLREAKLGFDSTLEDNDPLLPQRLQELLSELNRRLFWLWEHFEMREDLPDLADGVREDLSRLGRVAGSVHDALTIARFALRAYRQDPEKRITYTLDRPPVNEPSS